MRLTPSGGADQIYGRARDDKGEYVKARVRAAPENNEANRALVFTFAFPLILVVLFGALNGNAEVDAYGERLRFAQFYTPAIAIFSLVTACYTSLVLGLQVRDCTSGYRAYRADALKRIDPGSTTAEGYAFLTELVRRLVRDGSRVMETPIVFADRKFGTSKMSGRIIVESMLLVTRWGVRDLLRRRSA